MEDPKQQGGATHRPSRNNLMLLLAVVIAIAVCAIYIFSHQKQTAVTPVAKADKATQTVEKAPEAEPEPVTEPAAELDVPVVESEPPVQPTMETAQALPELEESDAVVKQRLQEEFNGATPALFVNDDLIRRSVVFIDNLAQGKIARQHTPVVAPEEKFSVVEGDVLTMSPEGFKRYDPYVAIFTSLSATRLIELYREYLPLIDEAYGEIAPPGQNFDDTLSKAISLLLATPEMKAQMPLLHDSVTYKYAYSEWEGLPAAQKQLLRMGPENVAKVKGALEAIQRELEKRP